MRIKRKTRCNLGQEYISESTGERVKARELESPCTCKKNVEISWKDVMKKYFVNSGTWDPMSCRIITSLDAFRYHLKYFVSIGGKHIRLCKSEFISVHGLQSSRGRINRLVSRKIQRAQTAGKDKRGKHNNRANQLSEDQKQSVRDHIRMIPKYQSHYSRIDVPWCQEQRINVVKESAYRKIFCTEFNIGFKLPKSDTCITCDELNIKISNSSIAREKNEEELQELTTQLNLHKSTAAAMQSLLKSDVEESKTKSDKKCVITFDLQQAMPIPKLTSGKKFICEYE